MKIQEITAKELRRGDIIVFGTTVMTSESMILVNRAWVNNFANAENPEGIRYYWGKEVFLNVIRPNLKNDLLIDCESALQDWVEWYDQVLNVSMRTTVNEYSAPYKTTREIMDRISKAKGE